MTDSQDFSKPHILVDADACPVKEEVYKVAFRHEVPVTVVSNGGIRIPDHPLISRDQMGGPAAFKKEDRSRFLQALDTALVRLKASR